jgi:hypothetical protein
MLEAKAVSHQSGCVASSVDQDSTRHTTSGLHSPGFPRCLPGARPIVHSVPNVPADDTHRRADCRAVRLVWDRPLFDGSGAALLTLTPRHNDIDDGRSAAREHRYALARLRLEARHVMKTAVRAPLA